MSKANLVLAIPFQPNQMIMTIYAVCVPRDEEIVDVGRVSGAGGLVYDIVDVAVAAEDQQKGVGKMMLACRQWQARHAHSRRGRIQRTERRDGAEHSEVRCQSTRQPRVELYEVGPSPHVEEMVIAYLPKEKIIFVSDLCMTRIRGRMPPVSDINADFARKISKLNLPIETIANGHGWIGTMAEFLRHVETPSR